MEAELSGRGKKENQKSHWTWHLEPSWAPLLLLPQDPLGGQESSAGPVPKTLVSKTCQLGGSGFFFFFFRIFGEFFGFFFGFLEWVPMDKLGFFLGIFANLFVLFFLIFKKFWVN